MENHKVVGKLVSGKIGVGVLKIDDNKLLVLVGREQQRGLARRLEAEDVAVLCLSNPGQLGPSFGEMCRF